MYAVLAEIIDQTNTEPTMDAKDSSHLHAHNRISNLNKNCSNLNKK